MKVNDIVDVYNQTPSGKSFMEGKAKLLEKVKEHSHTGWEYWRVQFLEDGLAAYRWVEKPADKNKEALDSFFAKNI